MQSQFQSLDTKGRSLIHRFSADPDREADGSVSRLTRSFVWAGMLTYMPMLIVAIAGWEAVDTTDWAGGLTFFEDLPVAFMFLISFPVLWSLCRDDERALVEALSKLEGNGILRFAPGVGAKWAGTWSARFRRINVGAQVAAVVIGGSVAFANYRIYSGISPGYWISESNALLPIGYLFVLNCFIFYAVIPIFVIRSLSMSLMMQSLVRHVKIEVIPFHPDRCGGLAPVGRLGMRNQCLLTVFGVNVVLLWFISFAILDVSDPLNWMIVMAVVAYLVCGPAVFIGPLLPFRQGMLKVKNELMHDIARGIRGEFTSIQAHLKDGGISEQDQDALGRLRSLAEAVDGIPVWPFDVNTLKQFVSAYLLPVATALGFTQLDWMASLLGLG